MSVCACVYVSVCECACVCECVCESECVRVSEIESLTTRPMMRRKHTTCLCLPDIFLKMSLHQNCCVCYSLCMLCVSELLVHKCDIVLCKYLCIFVL